MNDFKDKETWDFFNNIFDSFSEKDHEIMNQVKGGYFFWAFVKMDDIGYFNTIEGIQKQLDLFELNVGFIYYAYVEDGKAMIDKIAVEIIRG